MFSSASVGGFGSAGSSNARLVTDTVRVHVFVPDTCWSVWGPVVCGCQRNTPDSADETAVSPSIRIVASPPSNGE